MAFGAGIDTIIDGIERHGAAGAEHGFRHSILLVGNVMYGRNGPIAEHLGSVAELLLEVSARSRGAAVQISVRKRGMAWVPRETAGVCAENAAVLRGGARDFACLPRESGRKTAGVGQRRGKEPARFACHTRPHGSSSS